MRIREKIKGTDSLTVAVRNEASMLRECYRTATVRESVLVPIFSRPLREPVSWPPALFSQQPARLVELQPWVARQQFRVIAVAEIA